MSKALIPLLVIELNYQGQIMGSKQYTCLEELFAVKRWNINKDKIIDKLEDYKVVRVKNHIITYSSPN